MRRFLAALALLLAPLSAAGAEEVIRDFASQVDVRRDGSLEVTETITVNVENRAINHGIYRDFPTRYDGPRGRRIRIHFRLIETRLDGTPEPSTVETRANGVRIKIGDADRIVTPTEHRYMIRYAVDRELGYFDRYDELYWNVTGNGWLFPIEHASALIRLPSPAPFGQRSLYTGPQGSTAGQGRVVSDRPGAILFETTAPLGAYEGLTVAAAFPKNVVDAPSQSTRMRWWLADFLPILFAAAGLAGLGGFLLYAYRKAGRDPRAGTIVPLFAPPDGMSPAAMRYLLKQGFDDRAFAAALVEAGVKGHVRLIEEKGVLFFGGKRFIEGLDNAAAEPLDPPEQSAITTLVAPGERLEMDNKNHATFAAAKAALQRAFKKRFDGVAFKRNLGWGAAAVLVWMFTAYLVALSIVAFEGATNGRWIFVPLVALPVCAWIFSSFRSDNTTMGCVAKLIAFGLFVLGSGVALVTVPMALAAGRFLPLGLIAAGLPLALLTFAWISAPTKEGRLLLDKIAGFKQYLSITERERLDRMQAPKDDLNLFERYLPYAIALQVENRWADRFRSALAAAAAAPGQGGQFAWYSGSHSPWSDTGGFVESIGSSLSSSISSSSTAPGSSSGSGGGGSSGGGGGGGGGGGW